MTNSNRINTICHFVDKKVIAEIGADHGYITLSLFENNKIDFAYLTDISSSSLQKAVNNFSNKSFLNKTKFLVGDGLTVFEQIETNGTKIKDNCPKIEQIIIAGMGGNEIIKILNNNTQCFANFVLQPQRNVVDLRKYLVQNNFNILKDVMVKDGKIFYNVLKVVKCQTKQNLSNVEILFGKTNLQERNEFFIDYLKFELDKLQGFEKKTEEVKEKILQIKKLLNNN